MLSSFPDSRWQQRTAAGLARDAHRKQTCLSWRASLKRSEQARQTSADVVCVSYAHSVRPIWRKSYRPLDIYIFLNVSADACSLKQFLAALASGPGWAQMRRRAHLGEPARVPAFRLVRSPGVLVSGRLGIGVPRAKRPVPAVDCLAPPSRR